MVYNMCYTCKGQLVNESYLRRIHVIQSFYNTTIIVNAGVIRKVTSLLKLCTIYWLYFLSSCQAPSQIWSICFPVEGLPAYIYIYIYIVLYVFSLQNKIVIIIIKVVLKSYLLYIHVLDPSW